MPRTALPPELRKSMGLKPRTENDENDAVIWKVESHQLWFNCTLRHAVLQAGSGVLAPTGSAPDGTFLKRGSGAAMSQRASALAQVSIAAYSVTPEFIDVNYRSKWWHETEHTYSKQDWLIATEMK